MHTKLIIATIISLVTFTSSSFAKETKSKHKWVGFGTDLGLPEGGAIGLVFSPNIKYVDWLKFSASYTNNYLTSGGRFGLTLDPINFGIAPTFTSEFGFTDKFNLSDLMGEKLPSVSYNYINLQPGLEFGNRNGFRFFIRGGFTYLWANVYDFGSILNSDQFIITSPKVNIWLYPSFKLGFQALVF